ncbi:centrosomal protein of 76 kda [Anaeramoeba flamelloides]|uniref:Centrosomal protein of 76 kDa n=1 Tax=Anaeramoeba flamelloides TaxID=1746091 RepID=A0ABQ8Z4Q2_9EUKA|nr:centrosomal protein of 76 kda [Anaeramoeba flamelloides]
MSNTDQTDSDKNEKQKEKKTIELEDSETTDEDDLPQNEQTIKQFGEDEEEEEEEELPPGPHFKLVIRNISIRNSVVEQPKIRFTFGGNFKIVDNRHKGGKIEEIGEKGKQFTTGKTTPDENGSGNLFPNSFTKYKRFKSYEEISEHELTIELISTGCCKATSQGSAKINFLELANSHIQREVKTEIQKKGNHKITAIVSFHCYFQEVWDYDLHFYEFEGTNLLKNKKDIEPDPQIKLEIKSSFMNYFKKDKNFFKRSCTSEHELNTNNPRWVEVGNVTYRGIFSELENEDLICEVYNHKTVGNSEKIGESLIGMRGFLDYGVLEGALVRTTTEKQKSESSGIVQKYNKKIDGGSIVGLVEVENYPPHQQYGDIVILKPGRNYIGVHISRCTNLRSADPNGFSDPFVIVEFGGFKQRTKIIYRSLDPIFEETLYFELKVGVLNEQNIGNKGNLKVMVFDDDEAGDDFLGSCEIDLKEIVNSSESKVGNNLNRCTSRVYKQRLTLFANGEETEQLIDLKAWFQPDIPKEFTFKNLNKKVKKKKLSKVYREREAIWRQKIPKGHLEKGDFEIAGADEDYYEHFIPTYMSTITLPKELRDRRVIARTIKCFTFENDEITFGGRRDVWCSPNFFLSLMKGSAEEHAALQVSMLISLEIDAYLCQGKTKTGDEHYWVMVREVDGNVTFCECSTAKKYLLEGKWEGSIEEDSDELEDRKSKKKNKKKTKKKNVNLNNKKKNKKKKKYNTLSESGDESQDRILNEKEMETEDSSDLEKNKIRLDNSSDEDQDKIGKEEMEIKDETIMPYMTLEIVANHKNLWANIQETLDPAQILYDLEDEKKWLPFVDEKDGFEKEIKPFYKTIRLGPKIPEGRAQLFANRIRKEVIAGYTNFRHGKNLKTIFLKKFTPVIESGLDYYEKRELEVITEEDEQSFKIWRGKIAELCPQGYKFNAYTINFNYTDPTRIRNYIMEKYDFQQDESIDTVFACGVYVRGYYGKVSSVWVMLCVMNVLPKKIDEKEENKKGKKKDKQQNTGNQIEDEKKSNKSPKKKKKKNKKTKGEFISIASNEESDSEKDELKK